MKIHHLTLATLTLAAASAYGQVTLVEFDFDNGGSPIDETNWTGTDVFDPGLAAFGAGSSGLSVGSGHVPDTGGPDDVFQIFPANTDGDSETGIDGGDWADDLAESISFNQYFEFTIAAAGSNTLDLSGGSIDFDLTNAGSLGGGDHSIAFFTSVEGFTVGNELGTFEWTSFAERNTVHSIAIPDTVAYEGLTSITIRGYQWDGAIADNEILSFEFKQDNGANPGDLLRVTGTVVPVPEPAAAGFLAAGLVGLLTLRRRR